MHVSIICLCSVECGHFDNFFRFFVQSTKPMFWASVQVMYNLIFVLQIVMLFFLYTRLYNLIDYFCKKFSLYSVLSPFVLCCLLLDYVFDLLFCFSDKSSPLCSVLSNVIITLLVQNIFCWGLQCIIKFSYPLLYIHGPSICFLVLHCCFSS